MRMCSSLKLLGAILSSNFDEISPMWVLGGAEPDSEVHIHLTLKEKAKISKQLVFLNQEKTSNISQESLKRLLRTS